MPTRPRHFSRLLTILLIASVAACSNAGVHGTPNAFLPQNLQSQRGITTPFLSSPEKNSPIALTPAKLKLYGTGKSSAETVVAYERARKHQKIAFTVKSTCRKVATVSPTSGKGPKFTVTVTAIKSGRCTLTFTDQSHNTAKLAVADKPGGSLVTTLSIPTHTLRKNKHARIGPKFISPSTEAMTVEIKGPTNVSVIAGLVTGAPGCTLTITGLDCTFGTGLSACPASNPTCYIATVTTYDAYDSNTNTIPSSAAPLSISVSSFGIQANRTTNVNFPFYGIPARITAIPGDVLTTSSGNVLDLIGPGTHKMYAEAFDADNNLIAGIGGPTYAVSVVGALSATATQPAYGSPRFTVLPPTTLDLQHTATLNITASYPGFASSSTGESEYSSPCDVPGAVCKGAVTLDMQSLLAVLGGYQISFYAAEKGLGPINTITSGIGNTASDIIFDSHGNLYASVPYGYGSNGGNVNVYALGSTIVNREITSGISQPQYLALDPSGNLFVLNRGNNSVTEYAYGSSTPSTTIHVASGGFRLAVDSRDDVWVLTHSGTSSSRVTTGAVYYYANGSSSGIELSGLVDPYDMVVTPQNVLYVSDQNYQVKSQSSECGNGFGSGCNILSFAPGSANGTLYSDSAYCGDLAFVQPSQTYPFIIQDTACGTSFAEYWLNDPYHPASPFAQWTGNIQNLAGRTTAVAVDQAGYIFYADLFDHIVYYFGTNNLQADPPPTLEITNGVGNPSRLAIIQ
jgi:hypothetical protein